MNNERLKVAIYAQVIPDSGSGGVESVLIGLVRALSLLDDGSAEYLVITHPDNPDWLAPYMGSNFKGVYAPQVTKARFRRTDTLVRILNSCKIGPLYRYMHSLLIPPVPVSQWPEVPVSDGFYESLGCDVMHFPFQHFVLCAIPSVFNPHDLQHLHFPRFFTPQTIAYREVMYPAGCRFAHTVAVGSNWVKQDVIDKYHISPNKVQVIPWAPPTQAYKQSPPEQLDRVKKTYSLDLPFALYPAVTWEHKNHLRLLEALAMVRAKDGIKLSLVCTGGKYPGYWPKIESRIIELRLQDSVRFLGQVPPEDLRALYKLAQFVIVPTLFEAASGPVFEAWQEGTPVACSNITSLPEQAGNAALLFDPLSIDNISEAIHRMASDSKLRAGLQHNGATRLKDFDWERTAKAYRAVYRRASRHPLTVEDEHLLSWDWMRDPRSEEKKRT